MFAIRCLTHKHAASFLLVPALLAGCMVAPKPAPRSISTAIGTPVVLDNFAFWNRDCEAAAFDLEVTRRPASGTISVRDATKPIPENPGIGTSTGCAGTIVASREVVYTPNSGFAGQDTVAVRIGNREGSRAFAYQIGLR